MAPAVRDHGHGHWPSIPGHPGPEEAGHHGRGGDLFQLGDLVQQGDFQPPPVPVNHGQQVAEPLRGKQGPHDVEVHLGEPPGGDSVLGDL